MAVLGIGLLVMLQSEPAIPTRDVIASPDKWSEAVMLPPRARFSITADGRLRIRNGEPTYFVDSAATVSMGDGLSPRFEFKSAESRNVRVTVSYEAGR
jgi:hypothetical protein